MIKLISLLHRWVLVDTSKMPFFKKYQSQKNWHNIVEKHETHSMRMWITYATNILPFTNLQLYIRILNLECTIHSTHNLWRPDINTKGILTSFTSLEMPLDGWTVQHMMIAGKLNTISRHVGCHCSRPHGPWVVQYIMNAGKPYTVSWPLGSQFAVGLMCKGGSQSAKHVVD